ncbi:hypothetical protein EDD15DRAFT_2201226 [Pisolithus albus]|nr:hypothetical protein EDD15DRAFT_2201226 [Pisolithus albus]
MNRNISELLASWAAWRACVCQCCYASIAYGTPVVTLKFMYGIRFFTSRHGIKHTLHPSDTNVGDLYASTPSVLHSMPMPSMLNTLQELNIPPTESIPAVDDASPTVSASDPDPEVGVDAIALQFASNHPRPSHYGPFVRGDQKTSSNSFSQNTKRWCTKAELYSKMVSEDVPRVVYAAWLEAAKNITTIILQQYDADERTSHARMHCSHGTHHGIYSYNFFHDFGASPDAMVVLFSGTQARRVMALALRNTAPLVGGTVSLPALNTLFGIFDCIRGDDGNLHFRLLQSSPLHTTNLVMSMDLDNRKQCLMFIFFNSQIPSFGQPDPGAIGISGPALPARTTSTVTVYCMNNGTFSLQYQQCVTDPSQCPADFRGLLCQANPVRNFGNEQVLRAAIKRECSAIQSKFHTLLLESTRPADVQERRGGLRFKSTAWAESRKAESESDEHHRPCIQNALMHTLVSLGDYASAHMVDGQATLPEVTSRQMVLCVAECVGHSSVVLQSPYPIETQESACVSVIPTISSLQSLETASLFGHAHHFFGASVDFLALDTSRYHTRNGFRSTIIRRTWKNFSQNPRIWSLQFIVLCWGN